MRACRELLGEQVTPEFLRCQIEVGTPVCRIGRRGARASSPSSAARIAAEARRHGIGLMAASTHPFADWSEQVTTDKERYTKLAADLRTVAQRQLICGMHVHVGVPDEDLRIDLHGQLVYFLPHLLALSTSSPFWRGRSTGLKSYRTAISVELPRAGLPQTFSSAAEYRRIVDLLVKLGRIEDASKIWWDLRPSAKFPTLELRITDVCTRLDDGIAIAALYQSIVAHADRAEAAEPALAAISARAGRREPLARAAARRRAASSSISAAARPCRSRDLVEELIELVARGGGRARLPRRGGAGRARSPRREPAPTASSPSSTRRRGRATATRRRCAPSSTTSWRKRSKAARPRDDRLRDGRIAGCGLTAATTSRRRGCARSAPRR